jgi:ABC-2 type transport system permease protein
VVAHLLRLKLTLLRNGLRRSTWQAIGLAFGALYALGGLTLAIPGLIALGTRDVQVIRTILVPAGAVLVLAWWVVPLVAFGVDATLDPARFVTFAIPRRELLTGLALSGLIGIPGAATAVLVLASALAWWQYPWVAVLAVPCAVLGLATCVIGSRATTTALAQFVGRRRYRELAAVVTVVPLMLLGPIIIGVGRAVESGRDVLPIVAGIAGWSPWGAAWAIPADVALGSWGTAALRALIIVVTLVVLVAVWDRSLGRALVAPATSGGSRRWGRTRGLGAFSWFPATPTGAVAARCLTYWARDPRYAATVVVVPVIPVMLYLVPGGGSHPGALLLTGPLVAFILGWTISADVSYDSTAFWTHVAAPIDGRVDRTGRVVAAAIIGVPATLVFVVGSVAVVGRFDALPGLLGASLGPLLTALGWSSVVSARIVYQVPKPGESPFGTQQGASMAAALSQLVGWVVILGLSLPALVLAGFAVSTRSAALGVVSLVVGIALGAVALVVGIRLGSRAMDRGAPELLQRMVSFG